MLQEALLSEANEQEQGLWYHSDHALWIDIHIIVREPTKEAVSTPHHLLKLSQVARQVNDYFQKQSFAWHIGGDGPVFGIHSSDHGIPHLRAICRYGASVADEWAAVGFIQQFTELPTTCSSDLAIECWDVQDGQILLIEGSANGLPSWVDRIGPEACRHRCWIRQGQIQLIAPKTQAAGSSSTHESENDLDLQQALETMRQGKTDANVVEAPASLQQAIKDCIGRLLPSSTKQTTTPVASAAKHSTNPQSYHHKAVLAVPRSVAFLIEKRPDLVNAAIVAFAHDALYASTKEAKIGKSQGKPSGNKTGIVCEDWVLTTHQFTRTNYAMIRTICSQTWKTETFIPKQFQSVELKRLQRQCSVEAMPHLHHAVHVGVRLAAGMNVLLKQNEASESLSLKERRALQYWPRLLQNELCTSPQWIIEAWQAGPQKAVHNLEDVLHCPVFLEELESQPDRVTPLSYPETSISQQMRQIIKKSEQDTHYQDYVVPRQGEVDTNEDWMVLTNESLEGQLRSQTAATTQESSLEEQEKGKEQATQLDTMLQGFQSFMVDQSGFDGVKNKEKSKGGTPEHGAAVAINPRVFLNLLKTVLDPLTSTKDIAFPVEGEEGDGFFSKEDYDAMLPDEDDNEDNDDSAPIDPTVLSLMVSETKSLVRLSLTETKHLTNCSVASRFRLPWTKS